MKTIPANYTKNGFSYQLLERTPEAAIYEQRHEDKLVAYEVVKVRCRSGRQSIVNGRPVVFEAGEYLPSTEEWGRFGWTYAGKGAETPARARYDQLNAISDPLHKIPA